MKRRSFLGLLFGAPIAMPIAAKVIASAAATPAVDAAALNVMGLSAITANFGTYTPRGFATGLIASPGGSFAVDFERHVMTVTDDLAAKLDRDRRAALKTIRDASDCDVDGDI